MEKIDEIKMEVVAGTPSLADVATHKYTYVVKPSSSMDVDLYTCVVKPHGAFPWAVFNKDQLVLEPRVSQHDMLYLGTAFNFELVTHQGAQCLKVTPK